MAYPHLDRIRRLRKSRGEVWQGAIVRVPQWVVEEGQAPLRPIVAVWVSMNSGRMNVGALHKPSERNPAMLLDALAGEAGGGQGTRSGQSLAGGLERGRGAGLRRRCGRRRRAHEPIGSRSGRAGAERLERRIIDGATWALA